MAEAGSTVEKAKQGAREAGQMAKRATTSGPLEGLVRVGYAVRGVLYMVVGVLAVQVALGTGGATTDKDGAIATIGAQPFGKLLLVVVAVGLVGYSLWGFVRAILDPLHRGADAKGLALRAGYLVSALSYGGLAIPTIAALLGSGSGPKSGGGPEWTARLLHAPAGPWLVGLIGLIGIAGGLGQAIQGVRADFKKDFKSETMSATEMSWATAAGRFGMLARGIVFALLGFFLLQAALHVDPNQAKGLDGALLTLAQQPHGPWVLGLVALGLVSFGVYSLLCARWIRTGGL